jgi:hypothetical protein
MPTLVCVLLLLIFSACGATPSGGPSATNAPAASGSDATTEATAAATEAPAEATEAPTATAAGETATEAPAAGGGAAAVDQGPCTPEKASGSIPSGTSRLVIGTGGTGGVFFPYGGGLAKIITEKLPDTEVTAEVTGGSVDNMKLVQTGDADLGLSTVDSAYDALLGQGSYSDGAVEACALAVLYPSYIHVVALNDAGITTLAELKGKQVSVGSAGSSTEDAADRLLEAAGLNPAADIGRDNLSVAESVAAMKDRKVDAFFWIGGLPTAAVTDLLTTPNIQVNILSTAEYLDALIEKYGPVYTEFNLPAGIYQGFDEEIPGIGVSNILFAKADMPEEQAYNIVKTIFDNIEEVKQVHPEAEKLSLDTATVGSSIPFHPGAIRFYTEQGVWNP